MLNKGYAEGSVRVNEEYVDKAVPFSLSTKVRAYLQNGVVVEPFRCFKYFAFILFIAWLPFVLSGFYVGCRRFCVLGRGWYPCH